MNVELLEKVKQHILRNPESLNMNQWGCGTTACISGWAVRLSGRGGLRETDGEVVLDLDSDQEDRLFYTATWPYEFRSRYENATKATTRAKIAAERIEHFIKTGGLK